MILLIGNDFFSKKIAKTLRNNTPEKIICLNLQGSFFDKFLYLLMLPFARVLYSISGSIHEGRTFKYALLWKKKIVQHFIGSDVLRATSDFNSGNFSTRLINSSTYLAEVSWIAVELHSAIGLEVNVVPLPVITQNPQLTEPQEFAVACYVGKGQEEFYGIHYILEAASKLPSVPFYIAGTEGILYKHVTPRNVHFLGWIDFFPFLLNKCAVYLRITEHDGLPFSIIEALSLERWVLYNRAFPYCSLVESSDDIHSEINKYFARYTAGERTNGGASAFVSSHYSDDVCPSKILELL